MKQRNVNPLVLWVLSAWFRVITHLLPTSASLQGQVRLLVCSQARVYRGLAFSLWSPGNPSAQP